MMLIFSIPKYIFRMIHVFAGCFILGNAFADLIWDERDEDSYALIKFLCLIFLFISGVVNLILLKPSKIFDENTNKLWVRLIYAKLVLWLFYLPYFFACLIDFSYPSAIIEVILAVIIILISSFAKTVRDGNAKTPEEIAKLRD
ncbi:unnamed protein product [Blepharisma stoltei]|uniref:Uncharacterized protein n=1 Tax=Blepharisma stoltei TaxID=1481888 RepID=A0AAU9IC97_9CILI|nr:unnamed protein product [Blepharisma stoltei]